jgi:hypothetical protein
VMGLLERLGIVGRLRRLTAGFVLGCRVR